MRSPPRLRRILRASPLARLRRDTRAVTSIEYGFILALIVLAIFASVVALADVTTRMWNDVHTKVTTASKNSGGT